MTKVTGFLLYFLIKTGNILDELSLDVSLHPAFGQTTSAFSFAVSVLTKQRPQFLPNLEKKPESCPRAQIKC